MRIRNSNSRSFRHRKDRGWVSLVAILALGLMILALLTSSPRVWATTRQNRLHQTVPNWTPTPTETPRVTPTPTSTRAPGEPTFTPTPTPRPGEPTATPEPTTAPFPPPEEPPAAALVELALNQTSSSESALPGTVLTFILQLTNPGPEELLDVRIEDILPSSLVLQKVAVYAGQVEIVGHRATITLDRLASGQTVVITVRVQVAADAVPGTIIDHQPVAHYAGVEQRWPLLSVALPPAELPPTGGACPAP